MRLYDNISNTVKWSHKRIEPFAKRLRVWSKQVASWAERVEFSSSCKLSPKLDLNGIIHI